MSDRRMIGLFCLALLSRCVLIGCSVLPPPPSPRCGDLSGRVFVITGGTQGLGLEIARALKDSGAAGLALVSRTASRGMSACEELSGDGCKVVHIEADLSDADSAAGVIERAAAALEDLSAPISGLVNAAALTSRGNLEEETCEGFDTLMATNVRAPFLLSQAASAHMRRANVRGAIVNIGSCAAKGGAPFIMGYSVSKAAVIALTRVNAAELAPHGIRVNAINMGWCYTENEDALQRAVGGENWIERADAGVPMRRLIRPGDVAATCCFLLSESAAMMSGSVIDLHPEFAAGMISLAPRESDGR